MPNHKTGKDLVCRNCSKLFYLPAHRLKKDVENHFCSAKCRDQYCTPIRSEKLRKKKYPFIFGPCQYCGKDIIIQSSGFDKPNRKFCSKSCKVAWRNKNIPQTEKQRKLASERAKKRFKGQKKSAETRLRMALANIGNKSHFWKGGYVSLARRIRNSNKSIEWRKNIFERDNYMCVNCGAKNGNGYSVYLEADHITPFSKLFNSFIEMHPVKDEDALYKNALLHNPFWDLENGRTLCEICHGSTTTFSYKANQFEVKQVGNGIYLDEKSRKLIEKRKEIKLRSGICTNCKKVTRFRTKYEREGFCTKYCHDLYKKTV